MHFLFISRASLLPASGQHKLTIHGIFTSAPSMYKQSRISSIQIEYLQPINGKGPFPPWVLDIELRKNIQKLKTPASFWTHSSVSLYQMSCLLLSRLYVFFVFSRTVDLEVFFSANLKYIFFFRKVWFKAYCLYNYMYFK